MAKMLDDLETFFKAHQYTTAALGVAATFSAVVVSLVVALISLRSNRTRIRANVSVSCILHSTLEGKSKPTYVTVNVQNLGILPVNIPFAFFQWKLPFVRKRPLLVSCPAPGCCNNMVMMASMRVRTLRAPCGDRSAM
jgi:hypothetical protein